MTPCLRAQNYFQQQADFEIHVTLNDLKHELHGTERIEYTNHSLAALRLIYFHLWPNAYRNENTALAKQLFTKGDPVMLNASPEDFGFIDSLDFKVNGLPVKWKLLADTPDVCILKLNEPLEPGGKISITTPFHCKIPSADISRFGHDGQAYYITQWFPKPAVFDNNGWNYFSYLDQGEYYAEFGTYDVYITLPENYVVGSTGELVENEKELAWLNKKATETSASGSFSKDLRFPPSSSDTKTLHYHQENIHDFAWFADKRWNVLKQEIELPTSKNKVIAWLMFTRLEEDYWMRAMNYMEFAIQNFSKWMGDYPYRTITAVDVTHAAGSGMEYPGIFTVGSYGSRFELEVTMAHEIGHHWFYGIVANHERMHPWMDEGLTNFLETRYIYSKYSDDKKKQLESFTDSTGIMKRLGLDQLTHRKIQYLDYLVGARKNSDQAPETRADQVSYSNYHGDVYYKTSISLDYLKSYLGDSLFDLCMQRYVIEWKFKHPQPADFKKSFSTTSNKNLEWFFDDLIASNKKLDYSISNLKSSKDNQNYVLKIKNSGDIAAPFSMSSMKGGQVQETRWLDGFRKKQQFTLTCNHCDAFRIDALEQMPELNQENNTIRTHGILKKTEPVHFQFLGGLENPGETQIYYSPVAGWNNYNKVMVGGMLTNMFIHEKKFEYTVMPMYAFGNSNLAGGGKITFHHYPMHSLFSRMEWSVGVQTYAFRKDDYVTNEGVEGSNTLRFGKVDSRMTMTILPKNRWEKKQHEIIFRNITIQKDLPYSYQYKTASKVFSYYEFNFNCIQSNKIKPSQFNFRMLGNNDLFLSSIENKFRVTYRDIDKGFDVRLFAGNIFQRNTGLQGEDYRFQLGGHTGASDYLFDEVFLGRTETSGMLSQQFVVTDGGFAMPTYFYRSANKWMIAVNMKTSLPGILPVSLFVDLGTFDKAKELINGSSISFDMGVELNVIKNIFTVYFPVAYSDDLKYIVDNEKLNYGNLIRFEFHLNKLNPLTLLRQLEF